MVAVVISVVSVFADSLLAELEAEGEGEGVVIVVL